MVVSECSFTPNPFFSLHWEWFLNHKSGHFMSLLKSLQWLPFAVRVKAMILICNALPGLVPFSLLSHFLFHNPSLLLLQLWLCPVPFSLCFGCSSTRNLLLFNLCYISPALPLDLSSHVIYLRKLSLNPPCPLPTHLHKIGFIQLYDSIELYFPSIALKQVIIRLSFL